MGKPDTAVKNGETQCNPKATVQVAEDQGDATQARPGRLAGQEAGELGDGEDEDQIEEQLDRRDPDLRRPGPARLRLLGSHAAVLSRASPSR
jgi:hypothetical protein